MLSLKGRVGRLQITLLSLICLALLSRLLYLGNTFQSGDNAALAVNVIVNPGYSWMIRGNYGVLINLFVKLFVGLASSLGITITEFWWKAPIALLGTLQVPLSFLFLRRLGCTKAGALWGASFMAILPIHVMQSRYLWGYEVFGVFFGTIVLWSLLDFFDRPTIKTGLVASLCSGLYLISHGYIIPFIPCLASITVLFTPSERESALYKLGRGIKLLATKLVWLFPLLSLPLCYSSILHGLQKPTQIGFFLLNHISGFVENTGVLLALCLLASVLMGTIYEKTRSRESLLLTTWGLLYLAPLFFGTPPGVTVVRGYMLLGTFFLVLCAALVLDKLAKEHKRWIVILVSLCFLTTLWGTVESIFGRDQWIDPSCVKIERGGIPPDPGSKAAGYLVRNHVPPAAQVLAIHRAVEPPNLLYYFGRTEYAYYDLSLEQSIDTFWQTKDRVDIVICDKDQLPAVEADGSFVERMVIFSENVPRLWIYARPDVEIPSVHADVVALNQAFDKEYSQYMTLR